MKGRDCPECRKSIRAWALNWRQVQRGELTVPGYPLKEVERLCLSTARFFRDDTCHHQAKEKA